MKTKKGNHRMRLLSGEWWNCTLPKILTGRVRNSRVIKSLIWLWNDFSIGMFFYSGACHRCAKQFQLTFVKVTPDIKETHDYILNRTASNYYCPHCGQKFEEILIYKTAEAMKAGNSALLN